MTPRLGGCNEVKRGASPSPPFVPWSPLMGVIGQSGPICPPGAISHFSLDLLVQNGPSGHFRCPGDLPSLA